MPQAIDLTINNGAGTPVAKLFVLQTPAAGDNSVASWALKEGTISKVFPTIKHSARRNNGDNARKSQITIAVPSSYTETATGLTAVGSAAVFNGTVTMPDDYPEALKNDFVAFIKNALAHALFQASMRDALPTT